MNAERSIMCIKTIIYSISFFCVFFLHFLCSSQIHRSVQFHTNKDFTKRWYNFASFARFVTIMSLFFTTPFHGCLIHSSFPFHRGIDVDILIKYCYFFINLIKWPRRQRCASRAINHTGAARRYYRHRHIGHFGAAAAVVMIAVMVTMMTMGKDIVTLRGKDNRTKY